MKISLFILNWTMIDEEKNARAQRDMGKFCYVEMSLKDKMAGLKRMLSVTTLLYPLVIVAKETPVILDKSVLVHV